MMSWEVYKGTLLLRLAFVLAHGYVHPDEFFQSIEITAGSLLHFHSFVPWEYHPQFACRSIVPPMISTGIPLFVLGILHTLFGSFFTSGYVLLYVPRLWMYALSLCMDFSMFHILLKFSKSNHDFHSKIYKALSIFGSCWGTLVFGTKYFSNTMEAIVLAVTLGVLFTSSSNYISTKRSTVLGALFALGTFTRFTFLFFIVPIGLYMLYITDKLVVYKTIGTRLYKSALIIFFVGLGFAIVSFICIAFDSFYFEKFTIAPLNNFLYNLDTKNLAQHGIHSRITHLLVNFPLLLGPMALVAFTSFFKMLSVPGKKRGYSETVATLGCILSYMFFISMAPHQELRFLVPLIFPTILVFSDRVLSLSTNWWKAFVVAWVLINAGCALTFGVLHQGGVTKALCALQHHITNDAKLQHTPLHTDIVFYGTYMPPRFLLAIPESDATKIQLHDLGGADLTEFITNLVTGPSYKTPNLVLYIVCPLTINELKAQDPQRVFSEKLDTMDVFWPHFSGEMFKSDLSLRLYKYSNIT